jgi:hypothetical protein
MKLVEYSFSLTGHKSRQQKVDALMNSIIGLPPADCPAKNYFTDGIFAREITIPKGVTLVGMVHKTTHLCTMSKGHLLIDAGTSVFERVAPCTFESKAFSQKAATALEETIFTTYHATTETDLDKLVEMLTTGKANELLGAPMNKQTIANKEKEVLL